MIKFKVYDKKAKSWTKALDFINYLWSRNHKSIDLDTVILDPVSDEDFKVCWFTGLKDKYGNEIYQGDLIQYNHQSSYDGISFEVKWSNERWGWVLVSKDGIFLSNEYTPEGDRYNFIEVSGNIFEHPELLIK